MDILLQETILFVGLMALTGWVLWLAYRRYQQRVDWQRQHLKLFTAVIEKFGAAAEFVAFLQSREGQALLYPDGAVGESRSRSVLRMIQAGIVLFVGGCGLLLHASNITDRADPNIANDVANYHYWGTIMISVAIALGIVALVTHWWEKQAARGLDK